MKKFKNLFVLTEGGEKVGFGHITRTIAIASMFENFGFNIKFIVNGDKTISNILQYSVDIFDWKIKQDKLFTLLSKDDVILIDSMLISDEQIRSLQEISKNIIFIDDERQRNILDYGFVVDWTVLSDKHNNFKPKKSNVTYLLGSHYTPLRQEFSNIKQNKINENIESVLITFGGSDIRNMTPLILRELSKYNPYLKKNIIVGPGFSNIRQIQKYTDVNTHLIYNANAQQMVEIMQQSDVAIASGGQTLYELAKVGVPSISILLIENARLDTFGWDKVGAIENIGWWNDPSLLDNFIKVMYEIEDKCIRKEMQKKAQQYSPINGERQLVEKIIQGLK